MSVKQLRNLTSSKWPVHPSRFPAYRIASFPAHQSLIRMGFCVPVSGKHIVIGNDVIFIR